MANKSSNLVVAILIVVLAAAGVLYFKYYSGSQQSGQQAAVQGPDGAQHQRQRVKGADLRNVLPQEVIAAVLIDTKVMGELLDQAGGEAIRQDPQWGPYWDAIMTETSTGAEGLFAVSSNLFQHDLGVVCLGLDVEQMMEPGYLPPIAMVGQLSANQVLSPSYLQGKLSAASGEGMRVVASPYRHGDDEVDQVRITLGRTSYYVTQFEVEAPRPEGADPDVPAPQVQYAVVSWRPDTTVTLREKAFSGNHLVDNREYSFLRNNLKVEGEQALWMMVDVGTLKEQLYEYYRRQARRDSLAEWNFMKTRRMMDFLGLKNLRGIGMSIYRDDEGIRTHSYMHMDGMDGAMKLYEVPAGEIAGVQFFPANTVLCSVSRWDAADVWRQLRQELKRFDFSQTQTINIFFKETENQYGFDPERLIMSLGDEWGYGIVAGDSIQSPYQTLLVARAKDNSIIRAAVLMAMHMGVEHAAYDFHEETVHRFGEFNLGEDIPGGLGTLTPTLAYVDGYVVLGSTDKVVEAAIDAHKSGNDITTVPEWQEYFLQLPPERDGIGYISSTYRDCLLTFMPQQPRMFDLTRHADLFTSSVSVTDYDTDGIETFSYSPSGSDIMLYGLSMLAALPDLVKVKEWWLDLQTGRLLEKVKQAKQQMARDYHLAEGTIVTADGTGKNTYDLIVGGYLDATPIDPRTKLPIILGAIGEEPRVPQEGEIEMLDMQKLRDMGLMDHN